MTTVVDSPAPAIAAESLHRFFHSDEEETQALRGVSLVVEPGELVAIVGPSGSGKSTLLSCLAGLDEPDGGTVRISGVRMTRRAEAERARLRSRQIGILNQRANLLPLLTVGQNIVLARRLSHSHPSPTVTELLDWLGMSHREHAWPDRLSGGETVRAGLALALANDPAVLIADEPTGELDSATEEQVLQLITRRARAGTAVIVASHSRAVAMAADRVVTISDGRLV